MDLALATRYNCSPLEVSRMWPAELIERALALMEAEAADRRRRERRRWTRSRQQ